ncbi:MAG: hypothetical protein LBE70_04790 [Nitrososphaerota archaeon]|nr:hypothetical protein [Nitrososphaerota archaeon]
MDLSKVLASSLRQRILRELSKTSEIRVMRLVSKLNTAYNELNRNLALLEKEGLVIDEYQVKVKHGKVRVISLNRDNPNSKLLLTILKTLDNV